MNPQNPVPLYEMFPFIKGNKRLVTDFNGARVVSVTVNPAKTYMDLVFKTAQPVPPFEIGIIEELISNEFGIKTVSVTAATPTNGTANPGASTYNAKRNGSAPHPAGNTNSATLNVAANTNFDASSTNAINTNASKPGTASKPGAATKPGASSNTGASAKPTKPGAAIMGRVVKTKPTKISDVTIDLGRVTVKGEVCANRTRFIEKNNSWLVNFDITDHEGTLNVIKFMRDEKASKVAKAITKGMHLVVSGTLGISKYDNELIMDPQNIFTYEKEIRIDNAEEKRVELHLHTKMSAMDALTDIEEAIKRAAMWGHPAIAITDHGVVHSYPVAANAVKKLDGKIKVIYGVEGYLRNDDNENENKGKRKRNNHIIILVKTKAGVKNLYKLITNSHLEHFEGRPIIIKSLLEKHREGLLLGTACEAGELFRAVINKVEKPEIIKIAKFYDYLEIMPICNNAFMFYEDIPKAKNEEELRDFNRMIVDLGKELDIPVVATGDVHFLDPKDEIYRKILLTSKGYSDSSNDMPLYFKTTQEMLDEFNYLGKNVAFDVVVKNPRMIADMCENVTPLPPAHELFSPKLDGSAEDLEKLVREKTFELYGDNPPEKVITQTEYELRDILNKNYDVIYMAAQKLVAYLKEQKSRVGSRGSIGSSLVAYLAGITEVNPLPAHYRCPNCKNTEIHDSYSCGADMPDKSCPKCGAAFIKDGFNIRFETFMGFDGSKVPDIDLNISSEHLALAHNFVYEMFGSGYVYRAGTIGTVKEGNAFRFMRKYLETTGKTATKAEENRLAQGCLGVKQTTGQHPGGLIVIPQNKEVTDFCPAQHPADDKDIGVITLHFEYKYIEDNLIKLDILGHDNPTMLKMLEDMTGVNADDISLDDPLTMSIFSSPVPLGLPANDAIIGETGSIGIPEFGTSFTREMLKDTKPRNFDTLIRLSGYSHGENVWLDNAKSLIETGKVTVDETISSRDDIMNFLIFKGMTDRNAFRISEFVRKPGKGLPDGAEEEMVALGIPKWYIESCKKINYLFPKAHAVAYVMMAFRIAWFKVHRPLEFYSAHFYRRRKYFDVDFMTRGIDIVRNKIKELQNNTDSKTGKEEGLLTTLESCYEYYLRGFNFAGVDLFDSDCEKFLVVDKKRLRPPFIAINGLGETAAYDLAARRADHEFISIDDISAACPSVNKTNIEKLKSLGALRNLPDSSQLSLF